MPRIESLALAGPVGKLEALLGVPDGDPEAVGVVLHPHPLYGGSMHSKVVFRAAKTLERHGIAALRFNFRGVGGSAGAHDDGRGEAKDTRAAVLTLVERYPGLPLIVGGFSFGAVMALSCLPSDPRVKARFAIGFPLSERPLPVPLPRNVFFLQGADDAFGRGIDLEQALAGARPLAVIPEADHFFTGKLVALERALESWLQTKPYFFSGFS